MKVDVIIEAKSEQPLIVCTKPTIAVSVYQQYGQSWADSTRLGITRLHTFRIPKDEADLLQVGKAYEMTITFEEPKI